MNATGLLPVVTALSHEFGTDTYVRGGGGNTSCKDGETLFIKPSGTTLAEMEPEKFIGISRQKLDAMYTTQFPGSVNERESAVVAFVAGTVLPGSAGRPSVEAPLHNSFQQRFVVHTHPGIVNGLTCGADGEAICRELFPDALWMPVIEPGYILSMRVREKMLEYRTARGHWPEMLFLANHGLFVAHDEAEGVRVLYARAMDGINSVIAHAGLTGVPERNAAPAAGTVEYAANTVRALVNKNGGADAACVASGGRFAVPAGALSPDHIVYCRSSMYDGDGSPASLEAFRARHGYWPRVVATPAGVFGFGASQKVADLALDLAWDAAIVTRYAGAFGGVKYLDKHFVDFIENWEVESYRQKQVK